MATALASLAALPPDDLARIAELPPFEAVRALLERDARLSANELIDCLGALGVEAPSHAVMKRWRGVVLGGPDARPYTGAGAPAEGEGATLAESLRPLFERARAVNDTKTMADLARTMQILESSAVNTVEREEVDWSRLSDVQFSALTALHNIAIGARDAETDWWIALLARVPPAPVSVHPAHVALPMGAPEGPRLTPVGGEVTLG